MRPLGESDTQQTPRDIVLSPLRNQRGKRSVRLDLRTQAGTDVLRMLARERATCSSRTSHPGSWRAADSATTIFGV